MELEVSKERADDERAPDIKLESSVVAIIICAPRRLQFQPFRSTIKRGLLATGSWYLMLISN